MRIPTPIGLIAVALGAALALAPAVAQAETPTATHPHPPGRASVLSLTVSSTFAAPKTHLLACDPVGGDHPNAKAACDQITTARGDFDRLPGDARGYMCPMIEMPVTAVAAGTWAGAPVHWTHTYPNACWMRKATGAVFDF
ncbi:MAG TPA: SSI family serine proteinase inhibitor [Pseudonocardiaceae bacterium]|jgi:hypothetical protein|nr:SSI family serine proteinase inhibitor [Pseudonocardiaceae bacterium]